MAIRSPITHGLLLLVATTGPLAAQAVAQWPTRGWSRSTASAHGVREAPWASLDSAFRSGKYGNVDYLLVIRNGFKLIEHGYQRDYRKIAAGRKSPIGCGPGACQGHPITPGFNYYDPDEHPYFRGGASHSLQSTTKSMVATVLATAMQQGKVGGVETPLLSLLPSYRDVATDPRLAKATLEDLLTMRSGIEWHESDRPMDSTNTTMQLEWSDDWVRFTLRQPMDAEPGTKWVYNSGGSHLISAIVHEATGKTAGEYARQHLFGPLGITDFYWKPGGGGQSDGEGGLYLRGEDLAKVGYLYLHDGLWDGRRILPVGWVRAATGRKVEMPGRGGAYGYQWWRVDRDGLEYWATRGFGGNYMVVAPSLQLITVVLGWNVFGDQVANAFPAMLDAILASTAKP
jgi:CubicO group peptidase (beta-lactamase class C family)